MLHLQMLLLPHLPDDGVGILDGHPLPKQLLRRGHYRLPLRLSSLLLARELLLLLGPPLGLSDELADHMQRDLEPLG